ncbi:MAG TPA: TlyA family RNA methyltransferase [Dehalococcoidia bacterium]|jgi:23S rRNA (cytidine1920-2'-O)/16S rRNA (cytidine1409-2'-O)-methyltransferase
MAKRRLDALLVDRGLAESPEKARALVMAGQVTVDERPAPKAGVLVADDAALAVDRGPRYVSRGGEKLEHALAAFRLHVGGLVAADIGASTGGFTDCLLQHGAARVYAIDVGRGQLDYRLRGDARVVSMEGLNARELEILPELADVATIDLSFISLRLVLPVVARLLAPAFPLTGDLKAAPRARTRGTIIALFKPQFEAAKSEVPRGGVIRDPQLHSMLIGRFAAWCVANEFGVRDLEASPILGAEGNREFLFWLEPIGVSASLKPPRRSQRAAPLRRRQIARKGARR